MQTTHARWDFVSVAMLLAMLAWGTAAKAQCDAQWLPGLGAPGVGGPVTATTNWDPDGAGPRLPVLVVAGVGSAEGVQYNGIALWNGICWAGLGSGMNGIVSALAVFDGDLIAAGTFTLAGSVAANNIARWDGNSWQALNTGLDGSVNALTVYNGDLIAGGAITSAGGLPANNIARWNGTAWQPVGTGMDGIVYSLTVYNGQLVAAGNFSTPGHLIAQMVHWDGASWQPLISGMGGTFYALAVYNGELVAAGYFASDQGGNGLIDLARWNGLSWQNLGLHSPGGPVQALTVYDDELVVGGSFTFHGSSGEVSSHIARWNGTDWKGVGYGVATDVTALGAYDGDLIVGASTVSQYGSVYGAIDAQGIIRWNGVTWLPLGEGLDHAVEVITTYNGDLIAGGAFTTAGGVVASHIARLQGTQWNPLGAGVHVYDYSAAPVYSLTVYNGDLIAGGHFIIAGDITANYIARWNGAAWSPLGSGMNGDVYALTTLANGDLVAGGRFNTAGGVSASIIARWDGASWQSLGLGLAGYQVSTLAMYKGALIAGGRFTTAGGVSANNIAQWDGASWQPLGTGMAGGNVNPAVAPVSALTVFNGELVAGGVFTTAGGVSANRIARWNGSTWQPLGSGVDGYGDNTYVRSLAVLPNGDLIVGGYFTIAGGIAANGIARWDGTAWSPLGTGLVAKANAVAAYNGKLMAGGTFLTAGGSPSAYWATWGTPDVPTISSQPFDEGTCPAGSATFSIVAAGTSPLTYSWRKDGTPIDTTANPSAATDTLILSNVSLADAAPYACVVTNLCGTATSAPATLTVCPGDFNCDGFLDPLDYNGFINAFESGSMSADFNGDGFLDPLDYNGFINAFEAGC